MTKNRHGNKEAKKQKQTRVPAPPAAPGSALPTLHPATPPRSRK